MRKLSRAQGSIEIYSSGGPNYEAAATIFSFMAFPQSIHWEMNEDFWHALCRQYIHRKAAQDQDWAAQGQPIKPFHFTTMRDAEFKKVLKTGYRRLQSRMASAIDIGMPHLYHLTKLDGFSTTVENLALRMKRHLGSDDEGGDITNVKVKHWGPSRPVLHLACAFTEMEWGGPEEGFTVPFYDLLPKYFDDAARLNEMINLSEEIRHALPIAWPSLYREDEMISFVIR